MTVYTDRWALVTGASSGIGRAFALELARRGAHVAITARREEALLALASEIEALGRSAMVLPGDLSDAETPGALIGAMEAADRAPDILVNNAGYAIGGGFAGTSWSGQSRFLQVMIKAPVQLAHLTYGKMLSRGYGRIINVASVAGMIPGGPSHTLYGATKALLINFSQALAAEARGRDVKISALCPGLVVTGIYADDMKEKLERLPSFVKMSPEKVASKALDAVERDHTVFVPGLFNKTVMALAHLLPRSWAEGIMARQPRISSSGG
ncbi:SDR family NAD(P)-dependent oxidoreductase [Parvularcula sp. LCG005]|uniref:SDR family NAD(P)-dependent oxidoreductase n=1 Tax=Parvularcula sp. LCG005 TaxID=3078805 RepID=UPI002942FF0C|nr:SDR family NAD(P)-dependent oxidoreductase [Parvularcula sp. LCG005]WOI53286.1 SDR family NAD(P)-dependent oxidoreductase [Parvularcula sp. LCG005]